MEKILQNITNHLKKIRKEKGWSLDLTSHHTGVSKAMLGQIERGESSPTIATLWKIAHGFEVPLSTFLSEKTSRSRSYIHPEDSAIHVTTLFPYNDTTHLEIFAVELEPKTERMSQPHHLGVTEHVIVVEGAVEIYADGCWHGLSKGEHLQFSASQTHGYRNLHKKKCLLHNIIHYG